MNIATPGSQNERQYAGRCVRSSADTLRAICGAIAVNDLVADHTIFEFWNDLPSS